MAAKDLRVAVPDGVAAPTPSDITKAKKYIVSRTGQEQSLSDAADVIMQRYVGKIAHLCWKYRIAPENFTFGANEEMRKAVSELLDAMAEELVALIETYSVPGRSRNRRHDALVAWMLTLGTHNWNFRQTLRHYVGRFSQDLEACIAAFRLADSSSRAAVSRLRSALHAPYSIPEVAAAVRAGSGFAATMLRTGGTKEDPFTHRPAVGLSKVGATNITTMARSTLSKVWMRDLFLTAQEEGKAGYYVFRGSSYECPAICDPLVGFHPMEDGMVLPAHSNCRCYCVFVDRKNG